jgi:hypothetical protein
MDQKIHTKKVIFSGKELVLYSLDGLTWSSRKDELKTIHERHDSEKVTAAQLRGEAGGDNQKRANPFNSRFAKKQRPQPNIEDLDGNEISNLENNVAKNKASVKGKVVKVVVKKGDKVGKKSAKPVKKLAKKGSTANKSKAKTAKIKKKR